MTEKMISIIKGELKGGDLPPIFSKENYEKAQIFHKSLSSYERTPLCRLTGLAKKLGVKEVYVKDESHRFGLNAFKGLGAAFAVSEILREHKGLDKPVFVTATDGNHGRAVAWMAGQAGCKAFVFMPAGSKECRAQAIRDVGDAVVEITDMNYDDAVRHAAAFSNENGYYLVQDTGFSGYEKVPNDITIGYTTMAAEAITQLEEAGTGKPTHVFLQAGVGSMAGGVLGYLVDYYGGRPPVTTVMEAEEAACIFESVREGKEVAIGGSPKTIMAGLNCGEANIFTYPVLRDFASWFAKCPDWMTETGMRLLAHPLGDDTTVVSGESGAVGAGLLAALCSMEAYKATKEEMGLSRDSVVLLFSTEGNTDPEGYEEIIGKGQIPSFY